MSRLLLSQGIGWLLLSAAGLAGWSASFPRGLSLSGADPVFWAGVELLAIAIAAGLGAAEVGMACRMRGGPRVVVAMTGKLQGTVLAVALILAALLVMVGGSLLELMALGKLVRDAARGAVTCVRCRLVRGRPVPFTLGSAALPDDPSRRTSCRGL